MITELKELLATLDLEGGDEFNPHAAMTFPLRVTQSMVHRMQPGNYLDPLLLQFLPQRSEDYFDKDYGEDPLEEKSYSPIVGLIHRYQGRVLLLVTDECPINCRFCFRRHGRKKISDWQSVFSYIERDSTLEEVILSGGDPFMLSDCQLNEIFLRLAEMRHIKRIRIHSRIPVAEPKRIVSGFLSSKLPLILVIHCNHPNELNGEVAEALERLRASKVTLLNQSVLLRRINDSGQTLIQLSNKLFSFGVIPYYLHVLDKVTGAQHFNVGIGAAKKIHNMLRRELPGYLVPRLVVERRGGKIYL